MKKFLQPTSFFASLRLCVKSLCVLCLMPFIYETLFAYTGEVIKSFKTPGSFPTGLAWDGKNLWLADRKDKKIYCIDPSNGKVIRSIPSPGYWPMGLTWDGQALWCSDFKGGIPLTEHYDGIIYRIDPKEGNVLKIVKAACYMTRGLAWDGKYIWCADGKANKIIQFNSDDGTEIKTLAGPASSPSGLAFDGKYIWSADYNVSEIYMIDPASGTVIIVTDAPGTMTSSLAFDGKSLWATDYQECKLYQLKVRDSVISRKYNETKGKYTFTHMTTNFGPGRIKTLDVNLAIPVARNNQDILEIKYVPAYTDIVTDRWGQQTAHFHSDNLKPQTNSTVEMTVKVSLYDVRFFVYPEMVGSLDKIPAEIKNKYLEDNEKFQYTDPVIQNALKAALGDEKNPWWMTRKIFNYVIDHMYYEMAGGWNTAPTVLARGNGSCSEYSFVFIAMCRAAGIPARYVGTVQKIRDAWYDDGFHRWVEVWLPDVGWYPVDATIAKTKSPGERADNFGFIANHFVITTQGGGGSETMGWTYNSNESYTTEPKTNVVTDNFADFLPY